MNLDQEIQKQLTIFQKEKDSYSFDCLFNSIKNLAYTIIENDNYFNNYSNKMNLAMDYASYLCNKIKDNPEFTFILSPSKYVKLTIFHIIDNIFNKYTREEFTKELQEFNIQDLNNTHFTREVIHFLRLYYGVSEINRLLPLAVECLKQSNVNNSNEVEKLAMKIMLFAKRYFESNPHVPTKQSLVDKFNVGLNSTITLSVLDSEGNSQLQDLFLSLDYRNLYRLSMALGGSTVKVPTLSELDELMDTINQVQQSVKDNKVIESDEITNSQLTRILASLHYRDEEDCSDVFSFINSQAEEVNELVSNLSNRLQDKVDDLTAEQLLNVYQQAMDIFNKSKEFITLVRNCKMKETE